MANGGGVMPSPAFIPTLGRAFPCADRFGEVIMRIGAEGRVLVAHRRAPVMRMIRANLALEDIHVQSVLTAAGCLSALEEGGVAALVLDADLTRETTPHGQELYRALQRSRLPVLVLSFDP